MVPFAPASDPASEPPSLPASLARRSLGTLLCRPRSFAHSFARFFFSRRLRAFSAAAALLVTSPSSKRIAAKSDAITSVGAPPSGEALPHPLPPTPPSPLRAVPPMLPLLPPLRGIDGDG
jgi:hypothetical protein